MRKFPLCLLLTFKLSQCLARQSIQALELAEPPAIPRTLDDTRTYPNSQLAMCSSSVLKFPGSSPSCLQSGSITQNSAGITVDHEQPGTAYSAESTSDALDDSSISSWASPKFFTDLSAFNISHFTSGRDNLEIVAGITPSVDDIVHEDDSSSWTSRNASTMLQIFYPKDSVNPRASPQGGSQFYASPLDITKAKNITFEYDVFFPSDFEWVKGGKLPGLYGGRTRCSGGDPALDCFSTRLMWRADGAGELYLVKSETYLLVQYSRVSIS